MVSTNDEVVGGAGSSGQGRLVVPLEALGAGDVAMAGVKGANLGELLRAGFPVRGGFVVTTAAYAAAVERSGVATRIRARTQEAGSDTAAGAAIRAWLGGLELPDELRTAIVEAWVGRGGTPVAVRSSSTAEDLPGAAFAGLHDTQLNVVNADAVLDAVQRCWTSLFTDRAIAYRRRLGIDPATVRMAVIVQEMVAAEAAGVLFTADPVSGARDVLVVEASAGLGEAVVSGLVTPDRYVLDRRGRVREQRMGRREGVVRAAPGGGVTRDVAPPGGDQRLPEGVLRELARLGASVAERFGRPQDVEWAWDGRSVWLLQARPITALPPPVLRLGPIRRMIGRQLIEMLPARPYPMDVSAWIRPGLGRMVARGLDELAGLRVDLAAMLPERNGVVDRFVPLLPRPTRRMLGASVRSVRRARRYDHAAWERDPRFAEFDRRIRRLAAQDPAGKAWVGLIALPRQALAALDLLGDLGADYDPSTVSSLVRLRVLLALLGQGRLFNELLAGTPTRTAEVDRALVALASRIRSDPTLLAHVTELDADVLAERMRTDPDLAGLRAALDGLLREHGHRETVSPLLVSSPTWSEMPAVVLGILRALVEQPSGGPVRAGPPAPSGRDDAALGRVLDHPLVRSTGLRSRVRGIVERARAAYVMREDTHYHGTRLLPVLRGALLETGRRLVDAGVLAEPEQVFHLRLEELEHLPDPATLAGTDAEGIRRTVCTRAARREELAGAPLISTVALFPRTRRDGAAIVTGTAAGGGRATGPVRVIRDPDEFGRLRPGDVLVCPYTNPAWTPLFNPAVAVVVDTGGPASHAAIVAREYDIPAVMGAGTATTELVDGQRVIVDGDSGRVTGAEDGVPGAPSGPSSSESR